MGCKKLWTTEGRVCTKCKEHKPLSDFYLMKCKAVKDGVTYDSHCKDCRLLAVKIKRERLQTEGLWDNEAINTRNKGWRDRHPDRVRSINSRRKAQRRSAGVVHKVDLSEVLTRDGNICHICGEEISTDLHFDHVIPVAKGGGHTIENLKPSHGRCNSSKSDKLLVDFFPQWVREALNGAISPAG